MNLLYKFTVSKIGDSTLSPAEPYWINTKRIIYEDDSTNIIVVSIPGSSDAMMYVDDVSVNKTPYLVPTVLLDTLSPAAERHVGVIDYIYKTGSLFTVIQTHPGNGGAITKQIQNTVEEIDTAISNANILGGGGGGDTTTASNGLTLVGSDVRLGGTLAPGGAIIEAGNNKIIINAGGTKGGMAAYVVQDDNRNASFLLTATAGSNGPGVTLESVTPGIGGVGITCSRDALGVDNIRFFFYWRKPFDLAQY